MDSEYKQHLAKFVEHLRDALKEIDLAAQAYPKRGQGPIAYTMREMNVEAERLENQIVALEKMLAVQ